MATYEMRDGERVLVRRTKVPGHFLEDLPEKSEESDTTTDEPEVTEDGG